ETSPTPELPQWAPSILDNASPTPWNRPS
ncbi:uncharacterized protein METZ01_LOCUS291140, partial [marine metagenome]